MVNVFLKNTPSKGTITDDNGNFIFQDIPMGETVVISFAGGTPKEFKAAQLPKVIQFTAEELGTVYLSYEKKKPNYTALKWGTGILALIVIGVAIKSNQTEKVTI